MIRINLLPHREEKRKELKSKFYTLLGLGAAAAVCVVVMVGFFFSTQLAAQTERNAFIAKENLALDERIKEVATLKQEIEGLKARQEAVEDLQGDRNQPVFMLNELVKLAPEGLYLTAIRQEGQRITLRGYAQSHAVVGIFVNQMIASPWMTKPDIKENKAVMLGTERNAKRVIDFELHVDIRRPREFEKDASGAKSEKSTIADKKSPK
jgi:type IV pilus assembly protein PilN